MATKGTHTQALVLLLRDLVHPRAIEGRLAAFNVIGLSQREPKGRADSRFAIIHCPVAVVPYRPNEYGYVWIDIIDGTWPDSMGDANQEVETFAAWLSGYFGPGAWPRGLPRACQHAYEWPEGRTVAPQHRAYIRIRCSYSFEAPDNAPLLPTDYDPLAELAFVTQIAAALVDLPEVLCFFDPSGECVRDARRFRDWLSGYESTGRLPLELWSNVRSFKFDDLNPAWWMLDTVGMVQLDLPDHEAWFQVEAHQPTAIANFLRNLCIYAVEKAPTMKDGDVVNGPGKFPWQAINAEHGRMMPKRRVIQWFPRDRRGLPDELIASFAEEPLLT